MIVPRPVEIETSVPSAARILVAVAADIRAVLADTAFPPGYGYRFGGSTKDMQESFVYAVQALALGVIFIYMILASQFRSFLQPLALMSSLPLTLIGVVLALWGLFAFAAWAFRGHAACVPVAALSAYAVWLLINRLLAAQAACLLGVVVDQQAGAITFPTFFPALRTVPLEEIARLTREDGNKLHIAGEFGSYSLRFSDKRRRDECIYLLKSRTGSKMLAEME